jgi:hypothetical protein
VQLRSSCTSYEPPRLTLWDLLLLDGEDPPDPNAPLLLCEGCAEDHYAFWNEMWDGYYRSRL